MSTRIITSSFLLLSLFAANSFSKDPTAEELEFFESKIRPILVENCYQCHSSNAEEIEGGLVLDSKWGWETGGDSGPAIVSGKPDESNLIDAVRYEENVVSAMPPKSKLPEAKIRLLERWVDMGAPDPRAKVDGDASMVEAFDLEKRFSDHWSWRPVQAPEIPTVVQKNWPKDSLDYFVLSKTESAGIMQANPASKEVWLRRVYFDMIGLPPTIEQIDAFLNDKSQEAEQKVVDQLLESSHFGEKWARHWMDLVRYAETYGHEFDYPIANPTQYRDYLIRAFNADVPYNQFVVEHIAGDLVTPPRRNPDEQFNESVIGTGFWYLHEATHAPTDVLTNEADITDNQLDVFGKTFLGLTVACARCHDHKFDAISTADYYALSAYIQSSCRQLYPLDPGQEIEKSIGAIRELQRSAKNKVSSVHEKAAQYFSAISKSNEFDSGSGLDKATFKRWIDLIKSGNPKAGEPKVADVLTAHLAGEKPLVDLRAKLNAKQSRIEKYANENRKFAFFTDAELPSGWSTTGFAFQPVSGSGGLGTSSRPLRTGSVDSGIYGPKATGILRSPTFTIESTNIHVLMRASAGIRMNVIIDNYQMGPHNGLLFGGTFLNGKNTDTNGEWQWKSFGGDLRKYLGHNAYLEFIDEGDSEIAIDQIWFSNSGPPPAKTDPLVSVLANRESPFDASDMDIGVIDWLLHKKLVDVDELSNVVDAIKKLSDGIVKPRYVIAMAEGAPEDAHVYIRGSAANLGKKVPRRTLQALGGKPMPRLELAQQIASEKNPLVARVIVNRIWLHLMGRGIVPSVDDFGPQGEPASHPLLLDHLASGFMNDGWSIKKMISRIVLSSTYRQASVANESNDPELIAKHDPTNQLLHRMRVRRLTGEAIRDAILASSGRLNPSPVSGSVATHRTPFMTGRGAKGSGPLDGDGRRSVYLSVYRNFLNPFMQTFDMPNPFGPKGLRSDSNVPAQALTLMNDPFVVQQAGVWADNLIKNKDDVPSKINLMVRKAHGISPTAAQVEKLQSFLDVQLKLHGNNQKRAWADLAHAMFNMKSFYFLK